MSATQTLIQAKAPSRKVPSKRGRAVKRALRRIPVWIAVALLLHASYQDYMHDSRWLLALLGPATVAFAVPIYEQRALIRRYWPILLFGVTVGSTTLIAVVLTWQAGAVNVIAFASRITASMM